MTGDFMGTSGVDFVEQTLAVTVDNVSPTVISGAGSQTVDEGASLDLTDVLNGEPSIKNCSNSTTCQKRWVVFIAQ